MKDGAPELRLAHLAHTVRRHTQFGRSVRMTQIPFSCQRRERLGLFASMNLGFNPARTSVGNRCVVRARALSRIHFLPCSRRF
jgi:hypothetical protein